MKLHLFPIIFLLMLYSCSENNNKVSLYSPDKNIELSFESNKTLNYSILVDGDSLISSSNMNFDINGIDTQGPFKVIDIERKSEDTTWKTVWGQFESYHNNYNEVLIKTQNEKGFKLNIRYRVFNDGVGFRYEFPGSEGDSLIILDENTEFNFHNDEDVWWISGNPKSYELPYSKTLISEIDSANTPITISARNGSYYSIHEAALTDYSDMRLFKTEGSKLRSKLVPLPDGVMVKAVYPFVSPWRTITIAKDLNGLITSGLVLNLNEPSKIEDTSWIKPINYIGVWWGMMIGTYTWKQGPNHGATTENALRYIDFAHNNNVDAVLFEGWNKGWENWGKGNFFDFTTPYDDFDMEKIAKYAKSKNIQIVGHHETGGNVPMYELNIDRAFQDMERLGIRYLKTGYAGPILPAGNVKHNQYMVKHYQSVVEKAAKHKIMLNVHEPIKFTGVSRTWPNLMTGEGARGTEYDGFSHKLNPQHTTILPYTRLLSGPMDYTPGLFKIRYDSLKVRWHKNDTIGMTRVTSTLTKQMALWVVLYSPMQMASDMIEHYENHPAFEFFRSFPRNWAETRLLNGDIGEYATIARRNGNDWYIGSITNEKSRKFKLSLDFLNEGNYFATIYCDSEKTDYDTNPEAYQIIKKQVNKNMVLDVSLTNGSGAAIKIIKQ